MPIVISDSVVLSLTASGANANAPRIGWHNVVTPENVTATEEDPDHPVTNLANPATYLKWRALTTDEQAITISLDVATTVNYFGIAGHNLGSTEAAYVIETSSNGTDWTAVTDYRIVNVNDALIQEFDDQFARFFRISFTTGAVVPEIAVLYVGKILRLQRNIYVGHTPFPFGRQTTVSTGHSETGQFLGRVVRKTMYETGFSMRNLTPAWVRSQLKPFIDVAAETPFFFSWRPLTYSNEVGFAWTKGDINPVNELPNGMMAFSMQMQGIR